jgi:hypothetical protein
MKHVEIQMPIGQGALLVTLPRHDSKGYRVALVASVALLASGIASCLIGIIAQINF